MRFISFRDGRHWCAGRVVIVGVKALCSGRNATMNDTRSRGNNNTNRGRRPRLRILGSGRIKRVMVAIVTSSLVWDAVVVVVVSVSVSSSSLPSSSSSLPSSYGRPSRRLSRHSPRLLRTIIVVFWDDAPHNSNRMYIYICISATSDGGPNRIELFDPTWSTIQTIPQKNNRTVFDVMFWIPRSYLSYRYKISHQPLRGGVKRKQNMCFLFFDATITDYSRTGRRKVYPPKDAIRHPSSHCHCP